MIDQQQHFAVILLLAKFAAKFFSEVHNMRNSDKLSAKLQRNLVSLLFSFLSIKERMHEHFTTFDMHDSPKH